MKKIWK